jgi:ubiquinone/menaquinone biosynthesis C-methylase UbiE
MAKSTRKKETVYLHGYSKKEQERLYYQARLLEDEVYKDINFTKCRHILEVGSGVGAQTEILLERFPHLQISCVDLSEVQLRAAAERLKKYVMRDQVKLFLLNAEYLHTLPEKYDGAFICWFLEHVPAPIRVLKSLKKVLKRNSTIYATEIQNAGFFVNPYSANILKYWFEFNDFQWEHRGNPFLGAELATLFKNSGYERIETYTKMFFYDKINIHNRNKFLKWLQQTLNGASPHLLKDKRVNQKQIRQVHNEIQKLIKNKNSVIQLDFFQVKVKT